MNGSAGRALIVIGAIIALFGVIILFRDALPFLKHLGRLPGDIRIERREFSIYVPVATCIIASILVTLLIHLVNRLR